MPRCCSSIAACWATHRLDTRAAATPRLGARVLAYALLGIFCIPGPLGLLFALNLVVQRTAFIYSAARAQGTVTWLEAVRTTRTGAGTVIPVFSFTASDGRLHIINSDVSVPYAWFQRGEQVDVLYRPSNPEVARIDAFSTLW
jgi:hypothetical protein